MSEQVPRFTRLPPPAAQQMERIHSLDFLRGVMMFLGILLHGMVYVDPTDRNFYERDLHLS